MIIEIKKCEICGFPTFGRACRTCEKRITSELCRITNCDLLTNYLYGNKKDEKCAKCCRVTTDDVLCCSCSNEIHSRAQQLNSSSKIEIFLDMMKRDKSASLDVIKKEKDE